MANYGEPTEEQIAAWSAWVAERPPSVRTVAERFFPWKLYRLRSSGHRVTIHSFDVGVDDSITLKVDVTGEFNFVAFERRVFGIAPDDLEECDLPSEDEQLGVGGFAIRDGIVADPWKVS